MNRKQFKLTVLVFLLGCGYAIAQSDSIVKRNIKALENYSAANPVEKIHLHLDRQLYFPGDTIRFKAYVVLGSQHRLSALSSILYAELTGPKDTVMKRLTLGISAGAAPGDFALAYNTMPGSYHIRAYTNWMRNAGPEYFYDGQVTVAGFNTQPGLVSTSKNSLPQTGTGRQTTDKVDLQFFPEGGYLVNGLRSKVAFKAINQNGTAEEVQGSIVDNSGSEVATFTSQHSGMGAFPLGPQQGKQYFAKVTAADGSQFTIPLPAAKDAGFTLSVNSNLGDSLYIKVAAVNVPDTAFYLVAQSGGKYYYVAARKLSARVFTASISKDRFPSGIVQFTLFSQAGEPVNERVVFIQNNDQLNLALASGKQKYAPGEKVYFGIEAKDGGGNPATGTFSVSVIDETKVPVNENTENTIFTDLLLKSELAGYIEDPNYYFTGPTDQTKADLDLLMLTQGYRRFEWKKILSTTPVPLVYQPEKAFTISGTVATQHGKPVPQGKVILTATKTVTVLDTLTDANGRFAFSNLLFPDSTKIVINAKKANGGENVVLTIDKRTYAAMPKNSEAAGYITNHFTLTTDQLRSAYATWRRDSLSHVIELKEVNVKDHKNPAFHPDYALLLKHSANLNGPGRADQVVMGDELGTCPDISTCLATLLHGGVRFVMNKNGKMIIYSTHTPMAFSGPTKPMAVLLDGIILDQSALDLISPIDIQSIEALESPMYSSIYGSQASGGLIIITTKLGDEANFIRPLQPGLTLYNFSGFYKAKVFYSPKYSANRPVTLADNRTTVYWQPNLITGKDGRATFEYFNAGSPGSYRVVVEGIDGDGKLARQVMHYEVTLNN